MKKQLFCPVIIFSILAVLFGPATLLSAPYYEGKRINIIVGNEAGGGYDRIARLLAKHLSKYIPGKPVIIVENMAGASGMICAGHVYNIAKPDGLTIGTFNRALSFAQLLKAPGARFDLRKYSWICSGAREPAVLALRTDLPFKTLDDLKRAKEPLHLGSTGPAAPDSQFPVLLAEFAGLKLRIVTYISSADSMLAIERKEIDGKAGSYSSLKPYIDNGLVRPLVRGRVSDPEIENLPLDEDFATDKIGKTIMAMRSAPDLIGRPFVAPPKTPPDIVAILKEAFAKVAKDPDLQEESKKIKMTVEYIPADECIKVVDYLLNQPEDIVKEFSKYIKF
jgi:tripartite-type tricarboxylate transporter receptor subunit TctC